MGGTVVNRIASVLSGNTMMKMPRAQNVKVGLTARSPALAQTQIEGRRQGIAVLITRQGMVDMLVLDLLLPSLTMLADPEAYHPSGRFLGTICKVAGDG